MNEESFGKNKQCIENLTAEVLVDANTHFKGGGFSSFEQL